MNEELERIFEQAERECEREREIQNLKLLGEINAEIDRVKKGNAELLAQINYLKGRIDGMEKICEK